VLEAVEADAPTQFTYAMGYTSSFTVAPPRRRLIPMWGAEIGGLASPETGHLLMVRPYLSALLWADGLTWTTASVGYRLVPMRLEELGGVTFNLSAVTTPW
jgi:hypothetical protein